MKNKCKEKRDRKHYSNNITHPAHHPHYPPPKLVQRAYPDRMALQCNHSHHHLTAMSSSVDSHSKIEYLQLGTPFAVKGARFGK